MHPITYELLDDLFSDEEAEKLKKISKQLTKITTGLASGEVWKYDKSLKGLGGYAMPSNLVINPFNTWGKDRNLFRSVQYAKSGLVNYPSHPRAVIVGVGRSLEITCKYAIDQYSILSRLPNKEMLGKSIERLHNKGIINEELYNSCRILARLTNVAKHEISETRSRTFSVQDGVVAYFALRKIHNKLLDILGHSLKSREFAIYTDKDPVI